MTTSEPMPAMIRLSDTDWTITDAADDVRGREVVDSSGEKLGKVADLLVDDGVRQVRFLLVEHGGILGLGATQSFIPAESVTEVGAERVVVNANAQAVAGAPKYDPDIGADIDFYANVYGYYGFSPFWAPGFVPPRDRPDMDPRNERLE